MEHYNITGMSCAACSAHVEKAVKKVEGVTSCTVSLLTNSMSVEGTASPDQIISAVKNAGYGAELKGAKSEKPVDELKDKETPKLLTRLISSLIFLAILGDASSGGDAVEIRAFAHLASNARGLRGHCLAGSLTGVVASKSVTEAFKGSLRPIGNRPQSAMA